MKKENNCSQCICKQYNLVWGAKVSCDFRKKVITISQYVNCDPADLMTIMHVETWGTFKAHIIEGKFRELKDDPNKLTESDFKKTGKDNKETSRAVGLIQFTQDALTAIKEYNGGGLSELNKVKLRFAKMGELKQLDYVKSYLLSVRSQFKLDIKKKFTLGDLYLAIFAPARVDGNTDDTILYKKGTSGYSSNQSMDSDPTNKDKEGITKKELSQRVYDSKEDGSLMMHRNGYDCLFEGKNIDPDKCLCGKKHIDLRDEGNTKWLYQTTPTNCYATCQNILVKFGFSKTKAGIRGVGDINVIQAVKENQKLKQVELEKIKRMCGLY